MNPKTRQKLVVIGNGMAGMRTIEELLKVAPELYDITVFGSEVYGNYNRIMLSPVLANQQTIDDIMLNDLAWYKDNDICLHNGKTIVEIDRKHCIVKACDGTEAQYDRLLFATGSNPFIIPVPGHQLDGVLSYRDINDVNQMIERSKTAKHAVVIGGGLLGLEAAYGLKQRGLDVSVVHIMDTLMERQLDKTAAKMLESTLAKHGIKFLMEHSTEAILGETQVEGIKFANGDQYKADLVVMAVGIKPNIALAQSAGLKCDRAILVNDTLQTYDPKIYAVGECVQHRGIAYGLVAPLFEQAKVCANHLAELGYSRYQGTKLMTKLKVTGVNLFSAGDFIGDEQCDYLIFNDPENEVYKKLVIKGDKMIGAVLYGETLDGAWYFDLINQQSAIATIREQLIFGEHFVDQDYLLTE